MPVIEKIIIRLHSFRYNIYEKIISISGNVTQYKSSYKYGTLKTEWKQ